MSSPSFFNTKAVATTSITTAPSPYYADSQEAAWRDFRCLWSSFCAWSVATGGQIGVKAKSKTAYAALRIDELGGRVDVDGLDPLFLPSGEQLPCLHAGDSYKHMGIQQRMNGDTAAAATAFLNRGKAAVARLGQLSLPVRAGVRAGNIVIWEACAAITALLVRSAVPNARRLRWSGGRT